MSAEPTKNMRRIFVRSLTVTCVTALAAAGLYVTLGVTVISAVLFAVACVAPSVMAAVLV